VTVLHGFLPFISWPRAMIVLGLNAFHTNSSAALLRDGKLIAAVEEERFRRIKHWAGFPFHAISYCLREASVRLSDVEHIAFNQDGRANVLRKIGYFLIQRPNIDLVVRRLRNRRARLGLPVLLAQAFPGQSVHAELHGVEHHLAHLASAFHVCPFDQAAIASIGGFGDFSSAAWGCGGGVRNLDPWPSIFPTFARHLLSGAHAISRISALWRRVQGNGACALRPPFIPRPHA
jgi:carbamoyltransferase